MRVGARTIGLSALFGAAIFVEKMAFPPPYDKFFTVLIQVALLVTSYLMAGFIGPVLTGGISGALLTIVRPEFFAITFLFAALYGLLVSGFATLFGINRQRPVNKTRLLASSALASAVTGGLSSLTSLVLGVVILNASMIVAIMAAGIVEGALGGYLASVLWERGLGQLARAKKA